MARRGSGLRTIVKVAKAIDRAGKTYARESAKRQKAIEREQRRQQKEQERIEKLKEREQIAQNKAEEKRRQEKMKQELLEAMLAAQKAFETRCLEREQARNQIIDQVLR